MDGVDRKQVARQLYESFSAGERDFFDNHLADDLLFSSPPDPELDRDGFFERCWPGAGQGQGIDIVRLIESGDEVVVTYELKRPDGSGGRNTEVLTFDGDKVRRIEVYFGWDLD
jgi:ketosteroid isomerase-like protein